jgi:heme/copper-type cytochrome/quinol oxidase subunit 4
MFTKADIEKYFLAEKTLTLIFMVLGAIAIIAALVFFFVMKTSWYKGAAIPFLLIGILQLAASYTVFKKADSDRKSLVYAYDMNPSLLKEKELPRMEKVSSAFKILLVTEIVLIVIGLGLFLYFKNDSGKAFWIGLGLALTAEGAITFIADLMAKKRADTYTEGLRSFTGKL